MEDLLNFLTELKIHNSRDWFQLNKSWYQKIKTEHEEIVAKVISKIAVFDQDVQLLTPRESVFRIYRDVRFSKNRDPYKTAFGAVFCKGGRKSKFAGYYLHIEPRNTFVGGGIWMPPSDVLKSIRYEIYNFPEEFVKIINQKEFSDKFGQVSGDKLTRPPKDFPKDFKYIELLKHKSFTIGQSFLDDQVKDEIFIEKITLAFQQMKPFIKFLNRGIENI